MDNKVDNSMTRTMRTLTPPVDVFESPEGYLIMSDVPGVSVEGFHVQVEENTLSFAANRTLDDQAIVYKREFRLPRDVDPERIDAELKNGVLSLKLGKAEARKPRQIQVRGA